MLPSSVPELRIRPVHPGPARAHGDYVLYWMIANRRLEYNFALQRAADKAREWGKPLVIVETLICDYPWASHRFHRFMLDGMAEHARALAGTNVHYYPFVEHEPDQVYALVAELAERAVLVVTDDFPAFILPGMVGRMALQTSVRVEAIDSNGLLPMRLAERGFPTAHGFRRCVHQAVLDASSQPGPLVMPQADPLAGPWGARAELPASTLERFAPTPIEWLESGSLAALPINSGVAPVPHTSGGRAAARLTLDVFLGDRLARYTSDRLDVDNEACSGLSPYLHFGQISSHEVIAAVMSQANWTPDRLNAAARGRREGFWGLPTEIEAFLDELITWRELGFNTCTHQPDYDRYETLPAWAQATLELHANDPRPVTYTRAQLEAADTHDVVWNAAQRQLVSDGRIHNYMRMLWGKKILEWSESPRAALATLIELNNRYALDGRDPNSYSGIFWCLGRYDRAWGPERSIFGTIRYMSSPQAQRKLDLRAYLLRYAGKVPVSP